MGDEPVDKELLEQLKKLRAKYDFMGQDISSYLDGLLYSDYLNYWDYIHLETLLSLQNPKTSLPDEKVFIIYHQITELYFKLVLLEIEQIAARTPMEENFFIDRIDRIIRYFKNLESSFDIMVHGMDKDQFQKFRMALLPASGFQSAQYRFIEIGSTDMINLVNAEERERLRDGDIREMVDKLYWKRGATDFSTGSKTLTLKQFDDHYMQAFYEAGVKYRDTNLWQIFKRNFRGTAPAAAIIPRLRQYDLYANIFWPLVHMRSAGKYLFKDPEVLKATGGTNWQKYLPPKFQKRIFFPELWSEQEIAEWGSAVFRRPEDAS
jgi:tryptophan 2,3-dioxygenase